MTALDALATAAALALPGRAYMAGAHTIRVWRTARRRRARGAWRMIGALRPLAALNNREV